MSNWLDQFATAVSALVGAVFSSALFAVMAGVVAKHSIEVQAGRYPFLGPMLYAKLPFGFFLYFVANGVSSYADFTPDVRNAVAALIGMAGPELVLAVALRMAKMRGMIDEVPSPPPPPQGGAQ